MRRAIVRGMSVWRGSRSGDVYSLGYRDGDFVLPRGHHEDRVNQPGHAQADEPGVVVKLRPDRRDVDPVYSGHEAGDAWGDAEAEGDDGAGVETVLVPVGALATIESG